MLTILFDFLCDIVIVLITTIKNILFIVKDSFRPLLTNKPAHSQLLHLQTERSVLLVQQDHISQGIADLDTTIQHLLDLTSSRHNAPTNFPPADSSPFRTSHLMISQNTPQPTRNRNRTHPMSVGVPYPLPFTPPHTPEEIQHNSIIVWVNELRLKNHSHNGNSE